MLASEVDFPMKFSPDGEVKMHGTLAVLWFIAAFPIMLTDLRNSIALLVFISVYAIVVGHWSAVQAARAEREAK